MRRRSVIALIVLTVVLFLVVAALLTRAIGVGDTQDAAITQLVTAEARGDTAGVVSLIDGCERSAACRARAAELTRTLRRPGKVEVLQVTPSTTFALAGGVGIARVAWLAGSSLPRVQCVRVRNAGSVLVGFTIHLLEVSGRLPSAASCPVRF